MPFMTCTALLVDFVSPLPLHVLLLFMVLLQLCFHKRASSLALIHLQTKIFTKSQISALRQAPHCAALPGKPSYLVTN